MALGELIIEDKVKITGQRVLDVEGPNRKFFCNGWKIGNLKKDCLI